MSTAPIATRPSPTAHTSGVPAAFFDMDMTLLRVNSGSRWIQFQRQRGEIGLSMLLKSTYWMAQYKLALLDLETVGTRLIADLSGDAESDMLAKCDIFVRRDILPHIAPAGRDAVAWHRQRQHVPVLLTSATQYVAEPLARELGIDHVLCTRLTVEDGRFTGTCHRPMCYGPGKVVHAERFAAAHAIDLSASYFYTDSYSDLPMLQRVGQPYAINPDARLRRHAARRGWPVAHW